MFVDCGPMLEHEKRVGYKKIVEKAQKMLYRPRPPSTDSSGDDFIFTLSKE